MSVCLLWQIIIVLAALKPSLVNAAAAAAALLVAQKQKWNFTKAKMRLWTVLTSTFQKLYCSYTQSHDSVWYLRCRMSEFGPRTQHSRQLKRLRDVQTLFLADACELTCSCSLAFLCAFFFFYIIWTHLNFFLSFAFVKIHCSSLKVEHTFAAGRTCLSAHWLSDKGQMSGAEDQLLFLK